MADEEFSVNFAEVSEGFGVIPAGWYAVRIDNYETRKTNADAKKYPNCPMINWTFKVTGDFMKGRNVWGNTLIHPDQLGNIKSMLRATGQFTDEELNASDFTIRPKDYINMELAVKVRIRQYNNEDRNDVQSYKAISDVAEEDWATEDSGKATTLLP
jgi:hypothetical protein